MATLSYLFSLRKNDCWWLFSAQNIVEQPCIAIVFLTVLKADEIEPTMQAGLVYIAGTASKMMVSSALTPVVNSTISLLSALQTSGTHVVTLQDIIKQHDIECTLQTIEATVAVLNCKTEPSATACANVVSGVKQIHQLLTRITDITASHQAGYISRWRTLNLDAEIGQLENYMTVLNKRFQMLCDIQSVMKSPKA
tara:strand:+ start:3793 stop:4380 length:588 start_codon:yes stop_codon:yes gene_type:complete